MRPHIASLCAVGFLLTITACGSSSQTASTSPEVPHSAATLAVGNDHAPPGAAEPVAIDLTAELLAADAVDITTVQLRGRTRVTVKVHNPWDHAIGELKIIVIDNPPTRQMDPIELAPGTSAVHQVQIRGGFGWGRLRITGVMP